MHLSVDVLLDYAIEGAADVLLQIEIAAQRDQRLVRQDLRVWADAPIKAVAGDHGIGQRCIVHADGRLRASYQGVVVIDRPPVDLATLPATPLGDLPAEAIGYLLASRYCEADQFSGFVEDEFAGLAGGALAVALRDWTARHLRYDAVASTGATTATATFANRRGVCRDYAHLLCALARAAGIPARCASVYAPGVTPQDFHAVGELWVGGGWHLVDATGMADPAAMARVAVGRDATDIAFMTIFGRARLLDQQVRVQRN